MTDNPDQFLDDQVYKDVLEMIDLAKSNQFYGPYKLSLNGADWIEPRWVNFYGVGSTCPDGQDHTATIKWGQSVVCLRCDALLKIDGA